MVFGDQQEKRVISKAFGFEAQMIAGVKNNRQVEEKRRDDLEN